MEIKAEEDKKNILLKRRELNLNIKHPQSPTPKKEDLVKELAAKYSVPENHIVIDYIFTKKGIQESVAKIKIYEESQKIKVKKKKVEEKPKEEVKEEKKEEEKPKEEKSEAQTSEAK